MDSFKYDYVQTYGLTETSPYLTLGLLSDHHADLPVDEKLRIRSRTGRPMSGVEVRVVDDEGRDVAADDHQVGEVWARGPTVTPGYWNLPAETSAAFVDGWLRTGDLAVIDASGYLNIVDRKKDMIITGGENVFSIEVENALYELPGVLEAAVFGTPHEIWGEVVTAALVPLAGAGLGPEEVVQALSGRLASYKVPRRVEIVDSLPRTGSGKISKRMLRERFGAGVAPNDEPGIESGR
jgi:acyl-CoA synthetase (AMP-forming)/AMP-acid ligase II